MEGHHRDDVRRMSQRQNENIIGVMLGTLIENKDEYGSKIVYEKNWKTSVI